MEKVIDIKEVKDLNSIYGPYARKKCQVTTLVNKNPENKLCYLDDENILKIISSYIIYLNKLKEDNIQKQKNLISETRKNKNMKASWAYAVSLVLIVLSCLSSEVIGIPLFFLGTGIFVVSAAVANNLPLYNRIEKKPEILEINNKINTAEDLYKVAEYEIERKSSMDIARWKIEKSAKKRKQTFVSRSALQQGIEDLRYRAIRQIANRNWNDMMQKIQNNLQEDSYYDLPDVIVSRR